MKPRFLLFLLSTCQLSGQLTENFEKSEISKWYPSAANRWQISAERPLSGNYSLQHVYDNYMSDHDQISILHDPLFLDSAKTTWSFGLRYEYNPSPYNHWAVFLVSDKNATGMHPGGNCNGYILGVNYSGSDDCIKLWKSVDGKVTVIMNTGFDWQSEIGKNTSVIFEIIRHQEGRWELYIDTTGNRSYKIYLGETVDSELKTSYYFGLYYKYSSGQDQKLWFDDIYINGCFTRDIKPPQIISALCHEPGQLTLRFDEPITFKDDAQPEIKTTRESLTIDSVRVADENLFIWMKEPLKNESEILIKVCHITDIYGNLSDCDSLVFFYYMPGFNDLIVTEIMADPLPSVGLPEAEYLELLNRCKYPFNLSGWQICAGSKCASFAQDTIQPGEYLLLYKNQSQDLFSDATRKVIMDDFPRISNDGQIIVLKDNHHQIIFSIRYNSGWYQDNYKSDGGWSLEMIDTGNPCGGKSNWKASADMNGGTPGYANSVSGHNPDYFNPELIQSVITSDSTLYLLFSETVAGENLYANDNYLVNNNIGMPYLSIPGSDLLNSVILYFHKQFRNDIYYSLQIRDKPADCSGNVPDRILKSAFKRPRICDSMDLIFNEILFDPPSTDGEFIEIYNKSDKAIDLRNFHISLSNLYSLKQHASFVISEYPYVIEPGGFLVLTGNPDLITDNYHVKCRYDLLEIEKFPVLPNNGAVLSLHDTANNIMDEVVYSPDLHIDIAYNTRGISLERIDPEGLSSFPGNWTSASGNFGYATPGYENSQFKKEMFASFTITAEPEIITPDCDGINDVTVIRYNAGDVGYFANIIVFDRTGRPIKIIAQNLLLGAAGEFIWNGITGDGRPAPVGPYLIYSEVYNLSGYLKKFKNSCIIAEKIY